MQMVCSFYSHFLKDDVNMQKILLSIILFLSFLPSALSGTWVDNFDDGDLDRWYIYVFDDLALMQVFDVEKKFKVENEVVIAGNDNSKFSHGATMIKPESCNTWTDYTAEVSFRLPKPIRDFPKGSFVALYIRNIGVPCYTFGIRNSSECELAEASVITNFDIILVSKIPFSAEANRWYRLKMTAEGNLISCFIDEEKITEFVNDINPAGAAGFIVKGIVTEFDNFVVSGPGIPDNTVGQSVGPSGKLATTWANIRARR